MYKLVTITNQLSGETITSVVHLEKNMGIPMTPDNTDYQQYLAWLEAGNTPLPADEPTPGA